MNTKESHTIDQVCRGELLIEQPRDGYRFNVDSVIVADFIHKRVSPVPRIADLGAGCGIIGLLIARRWKRSQVVLVEQQPELALLAQANVERNDLSSSTRVVEADLRDIEAWCRPPPDLVVSNPPFFKLGAGRVNANPQIARAKHELLCTLDEVLVAASKGVATGGTLVLIHLMTRLDEILNILNQDCILPREIRGIKPLPKKDCSRVLVRADQGYTGKLHELEPLVIERTAGCYSEEMSELLRETERSKP